MTRRASAVDSTTIRWRNARLGGMSAHLMGLPKSAFIRLSICALMENLLGVFARIIHTSMAPSMEPARYRGDPRATILSRRITPKAASAADGHGKQRSGTWNRGSPPATPSGHEAIHQAPVIMINPATILTQRNGHCRCGWPVVADANSRRRAVESARDITAGCNELQCNTSPPRDWNCGGEEPRRSSRGSAEATSSVHMQSAAEHGDRCHGQAHE